MLTGIRKIKGLGVFENYTAPTDQSPFGRYNVIYGENGAGKTTISRLLGCLETGEHPDHPDLEFTIDTQSGPLTRGSSYGRRVRVFNSDFVEANIGRLDGPLKHILILGEENKDAAAELKPDIVTRDQRRLRLGELGPRHAKMETNRGKLFSAVAKTIGEATSGSTLRSYRKPDAEAAYAKLHATRQLSENELDVHRATVRQEVMAAIGTVQVPKVVSKEGRMIDALTRAAGAASRANELAGRSVQSIAIGRLVANPKISSWVEEGLDIHAAHGSGRCEYCDQPIPVERLHALAEHFSAADQQFKEEIEAERTDLHTTMDALKRFPYKEQSALYSELRDGWHATGERLGLAIASLWRELHVIDSALADKLTRRTQAYDLHVASDAAPCLEICGELNELARRHDSKTASFDIARDDARAALEAHHLLAVREQVVEFDKELLDLKAEIDLLNEGGAELDDARGLRAIEAAIIKNQAKVSSSHAGGEGLTKHLKQFLGSKPNQHLEG